MCCRRSPTTARSTPARPEVRAMVLPDVFSTRTSPTGMYAQAGLDAKAIVAKVFEALGRGEEAAKSLIA